MATQNIATQDGFQAEIAVRPARRDGKTAMRLAKAAATLWLWDKATQILPLLVAHDSIQMATALALPASILAMDLATDKEILKAAAAKIEAFFKEQE